MGIQIIHQLDYVKVQQRLWYRDDSNATSSTTLYGFSSFVIVAFTAEPLTVLRLGRAGLMQLQMGNFQGSVEAVHCTLKQPNSAPLYNLSSPFT